MNRQGLQEGSINSKTKYNRGRGRKEKKERRVGAFCVLPRGKCARFLKGRSDRKKGKEVPEETEKSSGLKGKLKKEPLRDQGEGLTGKSSTIVNGEK